MTTNTLPSWLTEDEVLVATHGDVVPPAPLDRGVYEYVDTLNDLIDDEPAFEPYEKALVDSYDEESPREHECDCSWCRPVESFTTIDHPSVEDVSTDDPFLATERQPFIDALDAGPFDFYPDEPSVPIEPAPSFTLSLDEMGELNKLVWDGYNAITALSAFLENIDARATREHNGLPPRPTFAEEDQFIEALRESFDAIFAS